MDVYIIIFNQFEQLAKLLKSEFAITIEKNSLPMMIEVDSHRIQLLNMNNHFGVITSMNLVFEHENIAINSYAINDDSEQLNLATESTSGSLGLEFYQSDKKVREWREIEGEVIANIGDALEFEPNNTFTSEQDEEGTRDEWALITVAEHYLSVEFDNWGVDLEGL